MVPSVPFPPQLRRLAPVLVAGTLLSLGAQPSRAHGIESSLERLGSLSQGLNFETSSAGDHRARVGAAATPTLQLESHFSSGMPASDALVRLVPPGGGPAIDLGRTNAAGRLSFRLPPGAQPDWEVQVDAGPGHRDYLELPTNPQGPAARQGLHGAGQVLAQAWHSSSAGMIGGLAMVGLLGGLLLRRRPG